MGQEAKFLGNMGIEARSLQQDLFRVNALGFAVC
jgi:hypothetical protein